MTDDTISRQAAIDLAKDLCVPTKDGSIYRHRCIDPDAIRELPSAQPEREKGEWIYGENDGQDGWFCSECGGFVPWDYNYYGLNNINFIADFKTCPFCDAKMVSYTGKDLREGEKE